MVSLPDAGAIVSNATVRVPVLAESHSFCGLAVSMIRHLGDLPAERILSDMDASSLLSLSLAPPGLPGVAGVIIAQRTRLPRLSPVSSSWINTSRDGNKATPRCIDSAWPL